MMPRFEPVYCFYPILKSTMTLILKWPLVVCVLALFCGGCGSAAYEEQFAKTIDSLRREEPFRNLLKTPVALPIAGSDEVVSLRLPKLFDASAGNVYAFDAIAQNPLDPSKSLQKSRWYPDFLTASKDFDLEPYHLMTYEARIAPTGGQGEVSPGTLQCIIFAVPKKIKKGKKNESLKNSLADAFSFAWIDLKVPTPAGTERSIYKGIDEEAPKRLFYLIPADQFDVVLVWQTPAPVALELHLDDPSPALLPKDISLARATAGSVQVEPAVAKTAAPEN